MEKQRSLSTFNKGDHSAVTENIEKALEAHRWETPFLGYEKDLQSESELLLLLSLEGKEVKELSAGTSGIAVFDKTPFYAESGGQIGDKGEISAKGTKAFVESTSKSAKTFLHRIKVTEGTLKAGANYHLAVDAKLRRQTAINHTATHMLHAALRTVLGDRVKQAGSLVDPTRLRFDFTYPRAMTTEEITKVENIINERVVEDDEVTVREMGYDDAIKSGALAFFDEKYGDKVRVVRVGGNNPFSVELCGGTHLSRTSEIGFFKVVSESSVASGVRRIEAITSATAFNFLQERNGMLRSIEEQLAVVGKAVPQKISQLQTQLKSLQKENEDLKLKLVQGGGGGKSPADGGGSLWDRKVVIKDIQLVRELVPSVNPKILRTLVDQIRDKLKEKTIVCLASHTDGKVSMCVGLTKDLTEKWSASQIIQPLAAEVGGTGGGKADFAQAGGNNPDGFAKAVQALEEWVKNHA
jgi:alanyl-tRNA synthetase